MARPQLVPAAMDQCNRPASLKLIPCLANMTPMDCVADSRSTEVSRIADASGGTYVIRPLVTSHREKYAHEIQQNQQVTEIRLRRHSAADIPCG